MFAVIFDLEGQLDCTLHETKAEADAEAARLSEKYAAERASYSASVAVQAVQLPPAYIEAPAMRAALKAADAFFRSDPNLRRDGWMADTARQVAAAIAQPADPIEEIASDLERYTVRIDASFSYEVEAEDEDSAIEQAEAQFDKDQTGGRITETLVFEGED